MLKGIRISLVILISVSLAACTQTTGNMTKAERRKAEAQNRAVGQLILGVALVGAGVALGATAGAGRHAGPRYRAGPRRGGGNRCAPMYASSTPTNTWGPGSMCLGN